jgi:hypothetical protein
MELADCYRRLGRVTEARTTLERAQRYASVATAARRELTRIHQMERARARAAPPVEATTADEAAAEAAY